MKKFKWGGGGVHRCRALSLEGEEWREGGIRVRRVDALGKRSGGGRKEKEKKNVSPGLLFSCEDG